MWTNKGTQRPPFAEEPAQGQESVWDYPRPPSLLTDTRLVEIYSGDRLDNRRNRRAFQGRTGHRPLVAEST